VFNGNVAQNALFVNVKAGDSCCSVYSTALGKEKMVRL
jgi:hypothetical protein